MCRYLTLHQRLDNALQRLVAFADPADPCALTRLLDHARWLRDTSPPAQVPSPDEPATLPTPVEVRILGKVVAEKAVHLAAVAGVLSVFLRLALRVLHETGVWGRLT